LAHWLRDTLRGHSRGAGSGSQGRVGVRAGAAMMLCGPRSITPRLSAYVALLFSTCLPILDLVDGTIGLGRVLGFLWNDCTRYSTGPQSQRAVASMDGKAPRAAAGDWQRPPHKLIATTRYLGGAIGEWQDLGRLYPSPNGPPLSVCTAVSTDSRCVSWRPTARPEAPRATDVGRPQAWSRLTCGGGGDLTRWFGRRRGQR